MPKHLRTRWRYIAIELETAMDATVERSSLQHALWSAARSLLGDIESARLDLEIMRFTHEDGLGEVVVRTRRDAVDRSRAVIATVDTIEQTPARLAIRGVSGTIRACEENYLGLPRQPVSHEIVTLEDVDYDATIRSESVDLQGDSGTVGATIEDIR